MRVRTGEFEPLRGVLSEAEEPLTASEILSSLEGHETLDSPHRVATILGRWAERGRVVVIPDRPYRYELAR
ncbi:hypothetical protein [Halegenticoccus soli]|uniref:hypothetical protein n=1 Tax=Halegenticoccus soli TaxID=1985678 RepID=UPI000C6DF5C6|nr:hypothetical protein [Halegenticoccus soli]